MASVTSSFENSSAERASLTQFFYAQELPYSLAAIRIVLPIVLFFNFLPRWSASRELFSADGSPAQLSIGYGIPTWVPEPSGAVAVALCSILLTSLLMASIGWKSRLSIGISLVLFTYLCLLDSVGTMNKCSVIATHLLIMLFFSNCGQVWSLDRWLSRRQSQADNSISGDCQPASIGVDQAVLSAAWPRRLIQLLFCCIYIGAAITKMQTPAYFAGDQLLFWMMTDLNLSHPVGHALTFSPVLVMAMCYLTAIWEVAFPFAVWNGRLRLPVIVMGIVFHTMTLFALGLVIFPMVCLSGYLAFLEPADWLMIRRTVRGWAFVKWVNQWLPSARRMVEANTPGFVFGKSPSWGSTAVFGGILLVVASLGVAAEYRIDPYSERRPDGPYVLAPISPEETEVILGPSQPLRAVDRVLSLTTGPYLMGEYLAYAQSTFPQGTSVKIHCVLMPLHEDMIVECLIHDSDGKVARRLKTMAPREMLRVNFVFESSAADPPGEYTAAIRLGGVEAASRRFVIQ